MNASSLPYLSPSARRAEGRSGSSWSDLVGITASLACVMHCLASPFLLLLMPSAGAMWSHPAMHWLLAVLVLPLALWVVFRGYRVHRRRSALMAAGLGAALILAGLVIPALGTDSPASASAMSHGPGSAGSCR